MDTPADALTISDQLASRLGKAWSSGWIVVDQAMIDSFAEVTDDHQFIHVDPIRASATPFGGTIAHGFLTLSLLSRMAADSPLPPLAGIRITVNYGMEGLRFISPVRSGARVRGAFTLATVDDKGAGRFQLGSDVKVEIEGHDRPALVTRWLSQIFT